MTDRAPSRRPMMFKRFDNAASSPEAARASLKILLPTVGCVFPTLWLILLGPALIVVLTLGH